MLILTRSCRCRKEALHGRVIGKRMVPPNSRVRRGSRCVVLSIGGEHLELALSPSVALILLVEAIVPQLLYPERVLFISPKIRLGIKGVLAFVDKKARELEQVLHVFPIIAGPEWRAGVEEKELLDVENQLFPIPSASKVSEVFNRDQPSVVERL